MNIVKIKSSVEFLLTGSAERREGQFGFEDKPSFHPVAVAAARTPPHENDDEEGGAPSLRRPWDPGSGWGETGERRGAANCTRRRGPLQR